LTVSITDDRVRAPTLVDATVRVGPLAIPRVLRDLGEDPNAVLDGVGIDPRLFDNPDNLIAFTTACRLLGACVARTGCRHFGLLVGQQSGPSSLGPLGLLMMHSTTVGEALGNLVSYLHTHDRGGTTTLSVQGKVASLGYAIYEPGAESTDQVADLAIALACNIMRSLCDPSWVATKVLLAHERPADVGPYERHFRAPVRFDAEQNALVFPARWLMQPLPDASPDLRRLLQNQVAGLDSAYGASFAAKVRRTLRATVIRGACSVESIAQMFGMQRRTLSRRLRAESTTFEALLDEVRFEVARQLLGDTNLPVRAVAEMLGYADAAFTRAFRRWSGTTPARWRGRGAAAKPS
jgi:AraC-like DNA-binding protein